MRVFTCTERLTSKCAKSRDPQLKGRGCRAQAVSTARSPRRRESLSPLWSQQTPDAFCPSGPPKLEFQLWTPLDTEASSQGPAWWGATFFTLDCPTRNSDTAGFKRLLDSFRYLP